MAVLFAEIKNLVLGDLNFKNLKMKKGETQKVKLTDAIREYAARKYIRIIRIIPEEVSHASAAHGVTSAPASAKKTETNSKKEN